MNSNISTENNASYNDFQSMLTKILKNIKNLHQNIENDQKSNILALVAYDDIKYILKGIGFSFSYNQYIIAKNKKL